MSEKKTKLVFVSQKESAGTFLRLSQMYGSFLDMKGVYWHNHQSVHAFIPSLIAAMSATLKAKVTIGNSVIVSVFPWTTLIVALVNSCLFGFRPKHVALAFNFTRLPKGRLLQIYMFALKRVDGFVVFSRTEILDYSRHFDLPVEKFQFATFPTIYPTVHLPKSPIIEFGSYIAALGSNNRNFNLFFEVARCMPSMKFVLVSRLPSMDSNDVPANVLIVNDISLSEAMNILSFAKLNILLTLDANIPSGHITVAKATMLGKYTLASGNKSLEDYIVNGVTGEFLKNVTPLEVKIRIQQLLDDEFEVSRREKQCREFGRNEFGFRRYSQTLDALFQQLQIIQLSQHADLDAINEEDRLMRTNHELGSLRISCHSEENSKGIE